jgi:hypothetical protein
MLAFSTISRSPVSIKSQSGVFLQCKHKSIKLRSRKSRRRRVQSLSDEIHQYTEKVNALEVISPGWIQLCLSQHVHEAIHDLGSNKMTSTGNGVFLGKNCVNGARWKYANAVSNLLLVPALLFVHLQCISWIQIDPCPRLLENSMVVTNLKLLPYCLIHHRRIAKPQRFLACQT